VKGNFNLLGSDVGSTERDIARTQYKPSPIYLVDVHRLLKNNRITTREFPFQECSKKINDIGSEYLGQRLRAQVTIVDECQFSEAITRSKCKDSNARRRLLMRILDGRRLLACDPYKSTNPGQPKICHWWSWYISSEQQTLIHTWNNDLKPNQIYSVLKSYFIVMESRNVWTDRPYTSKLKNVMIAYKHIICIVSFV
jgi:hypothetical protein